MIDSGSRRADGRNAILCAAAALAAIVACWPVAGMSFNDDFSYAFTVKRLLEAGHIIYNGWSSPSVISQSYWALLWVKAFGFSLTVLRLSTMPLAAGAVAVSYLIARRAGLAASAAVFVALLLGVSPLFLPLATSFMSDVPGCLCILVATYTLVRSAEANSRRAASGWMIAGVAVAVIGGSSRQIVYIAPLAVLPYVAWLRRRDLLLVAVAVAGWAATLGAAVAIQRWFERQPFALPEPSMTVEFLHGLHEPVNIAFRFAEILLSVVLFTLPAGLPVLGVAWRSSRVARTAAVLLLAILLYLCIRPFYAFAPWLGNVITPYGIYNLGDYQAILLKPVRFALALGVFAVVAVLLACIGVAMIDGPLRAVRRAIAFFLQPKEGRVTAPALLLLTGGYLALLLTRCALDVAYDRHLLPLIPVVAIPLVLFAQCKGDRRELPIIAWALLAVFAIFGIAATQESLAHTRARVTAVDRLTAAGIPRTQIDGGYEYRYWTELLATGYVNDNRIQNPPDAFKKGQGPTPHVDPQYKVEFFPTSATRATSFGTVSYFSLLPPMHRQVSIDRYLIPPGPEPFHSPADPLAEP